MLLSPFIQQQNHNPHFPFSVKMYKRPYSLTKLAAGQLIILKSTTFCDASLQHASTDSLPRPANTSLTNSNWVPKVYIYSYNTEHSFQNSTWNRAIPLKENYPICNNTILFTIHYSKLHLQKEHIACDSSLRRVMMV